MTPNEYAAAPLSDWFSDVANDGVRSLAAGVVEAANWAMLTAIDQLKSGLRVNLGADYVQSVYAMARYLVFPLIAVLFVVQVIKAIVSGQPRSLWAAVGGAAVGVLGGAAGAALVAGLLAVVDEFTVFVLGDAQLAAERAMTEVFSMQNMSTVGWLVVVIVGGLAILAFLMIMAVMIVRKAMIIATVVFGPLAFAGATTERSRKWVWRWAELVIGLALAKLVIAVILTLGFAALDAWQTNTTSDVIVGVCWVMLAAAAPLGVMKFVSFAGAEIANSRPSGMREAAGNIATPARRVGGKLAHAGAAGWGIASGKAGRDKAMRGAGSKATSPGEAAGAPSRTTPTAPAAGVAGAGQGAAGSSSAGHQANAGGGAGGAPGSASESKQPPSPNGSGGDIPDSPGDLSAATAATGSSIPGQRGEGRERRTDAQAMPEMNALLTRAHTAGGRKPTVHASGVAAAMGVPESQVERMFMKSEAAGILGPRDTQGRRRVLKPPAPQTHPAGAAA